MATELVLAAAIGFTVVTGLNVGAALLAPGLRVPVLSVLGSLTILTTAVIVFPLLVSTAVAETLLVAIVPAGADAPVLAVGFLAAVAVVLCLARISCRQV